MATLVLSAVGAAVGGAVGGGLFGLSSVVIGRAIGAAAGYALDQRIMGAGSEIVGETGRIDRLRLTGASEGAPVARLYGRNRVAGQVIWASRFREEATTTTSGGGGGKGGSRQPKATVTEYSYSVSLAIGLCEGRISRIGRVWADGAEIAPGSLAMRVYDGSETQLPDPKIEAVEGAGEVPAYRGLAYVVIEDLELGQFGNRVPQFSFEVMRPDQSGGEVPDLSRAVKAVALLPGTGEYALATTKVHFEEGKGVTRYANVNSASGKTDLTTSLEALGGELPDWGATSLVVSWFGDDLRCGQCEIAPKVEQDKADGVEMDWRVSGLSRAAAGVVPLQDGRPVYGGTPADAAVIEAIAALKAGGRDVMFFPFILMAQMPGNGLPDPYGGAEQAVLPWRGRITASVAPGRPGTPDKTGAVAAEVAAFFGQAAPGDFEIDGGAVIYSGPEELSYRRFVLHYAHLCEAAGGVDAFCIGSELRGLTQLRGAGNSFPAVEALRQLAQDVRSVLRPGTKIGYGADWSEYFGYQPPDGSEDVFFHLDPLWADAAIDFVGIDNYMPLADWRDGFEHADADWGAIYNLDYLKSNITGGEGYDWYYRGPEAEALQDRTPITDGAYGEPWVFRYKDLLNWWSNPHHDRPGGVRSETANAWEPRSKPIWFTELGCAAIDKGANEPNKFLDPKSSESSLPKYSTGARDDFMQMQYLRAVADYWDDPAVNPVSPVYGGRMVDTSRMFVWAWDARPYPAFPSQLGVWSDGDNYLRGHWLNGRAASRDLASVVREICAGVGVDEVDASELYGLVRGYVLDGSGTARAALQPLMLALGFDAYEREGRLIFRNRDGRVSAVLEQDGLAVSEDLSGLVEHVRAPEAEIAGRLRLNFTEADADYETRGAEAIFPDEATHTVSQSEVPMVLTRGEGRAIVERWLAEARIARDRARFALPPSAMEVSTGDVVTLPVPSGTARFRVDRVEREAFQQIEAVRVEADTYVAGETAEEIPPVPEVRVPGPVYPVFLDLPLMRGDEVPHAPHVAVTATPWPGAVAVYASGSEDGFEVNTVVTGGAVIGETETPLAAAPPGVWDRGAPLRVRVYGGALSSAEPGAVLNGANLAAIGTSGGPDWELIQFAGAELVGEDVYELSLRLRGQAGTDALMPPVWPVGSEVVLIGPQVVQIDHASSIRGVERTYRVGPAGLPVDDAAYVESVRAFDGTGLRPFAPVHLGASRDGGDLTVRWVRRTRIDGDGWGAEVPLGEAFERYLVQVTHGGAVRREAEVSAPAWTYAAADQAADGVTAPFTVAVAQMSDRFGPGLFRRIEIDE